MRHEDATKEHDPQGLGELIGLIITVLRREGGGWSPEDIDRFGVAGIRTSYDPDFPEYLALKRDITRTTVRGIISTGQQCTVTRTMWTNTTILPFRPSFD